MNLHCPKRIASVPTFIASGQTFAPAVAARPAMYFCGATGATRRSARCVLNAGGVKSPVRIVGSEPSAPMIAASLVTNIGVALAANVQPLTLIGGTDCASSAGGAHRIVWVVVAVAMPIAAYTEKTEWMTWIRTVRIYLRIMHRSQRLSIARANLEYDHAHTVLCYSGQYAN